MGDLGRGIGGFTVKDEKGNTYTLWANRIWTKEGEQPLEWNEKEGCWELPKCQS